MKVHEVTTRDDLVIRRQILAPGESTPWHIDACHRFTVVVHGSRLSIEYRDDGSSEQHDVATGEAGWDTPQLLSLIHI